MGLMMRRDAAYMMANPGCSECYDADTGADVPCPPKKKSPQEVLRENLAKNMNVSLPSKEPSPAVIGVGSGKVSQMDRVSIREHLSVPPVEVKTGPIKETFEKLVEGTSNPLKEAVMNMELPKPGSDPLITVFEKEHTPVHEEITDTTIETLPISEVVDDVVTVKVSSVPVKEKAPKPKKGKKGKVAEKAAKAGLYTLVNDKNKLFFIGHSDDRFALSRKLLSVHGNMPHVKMNDHAGDDIMAVMTDLVKAGYTPTLQKTKVLSP